MNRIDDERRFIPYPVNSRCAHQARPPLGRQSGALGPKLARMGTELSFDIARTALLAMDCQTGIVFIMRSRQRNFERAATVLRAARNKGMSALSMFRSVSDQDSQR